MSASAAPEPPVAPPDADTQGWWDATRAGRLTVQHCANCGHNQLYPRAVCSRCGGAGLALRDACGLGQVYAATVVHRAPHPAFSPPYVVALVDLAEGPRILGGVRGRDQAPCGLRVRVAWEPLHDGRQLPVWVTDGS